MHCTVITFTAISMRHPTFFPSEPLLHHKRSSSGYVLEEDGIPFHGTIQPRALGKDGSYIHDRMLKNSILCRSPLCLHQYFVFVIKIAGPYLMAAFLGSPPAFLLLQSFWPSSWRGNRDFLFCRLNTAQSALRESPLRDCFHQIGL